MRSIQRSSPWLLVLPALMLVSEVSAQQAVRNWTDKSGQFQVEAKLLKYENDQVQLLKNDGRVITVPLSVLSDADQKYVRELENPAVNPFAGGTPAATTDATQSGRDKPVYPAGIGLDLLADDAVVNQLPADGREVFLKVDTPLPAILADPSPHKSEFHAFGRPLEKLDVYARTSTPMIVDPARGVFATSTHRVGNARNPLTFGRIYLVSRADKQPQIAIDIQQPLLLLDYHVESGRALAALGVESPRESGGDLVLFDKLATASPVALARWRLPEWDRPGSKPKVEFARLLDADRALVQVDFSAYIWNLATGECSLKIDRIAASAGICASGGGKYLAIPTSQGCAMLDIEQGELLGKIPFPSSLTPEVAFSANGQRLALAAGNQFTIWDLAEGAVTDEATLGNPNSTLLGWIGDKYILTKLGGLIDTELRMPLWFYSLPTSSQALTMTGGVVVVDKGVNATSLLSLPVPHSAVDGVAKQLSGNDDSIMAIRPGTAVSLKVEAVEGVDATVMRGALQAAVERAGWKVSDQADIQVVAKIERGDEQTLRFRDIYGSAFSPGEEAKIKPYTASMRVLQGSNVLWSRSSTNMVPSFIRLEQGQTLQDAVKSYEHADPRYFERLTIPPRVLKPEFAEHVGRSVIKDGDWYEYPKR